MRKNLLYYALISVLFCGFFTACVNKEYTVKGPIDYSVGADMTIIGPVGHTKVKLYEPLPENFNSFKFKVKDDEIYLCKQDTQHLGNDIIESLKMFIKGDFSFPLDINVNPQSKYIGAFEKILEFEFPDLNTNPNERLDSMLFNDGQYMTVSLTMPVSVTDGSYIDLVCNYDEFDINSRIYPNNTAHFNLNGTFTEVKFDLSRSKIKLHGGNKFYITAKGFLVSNSEIPVGLDATFKLKIEKQIPRITYGYLGPDRVIYETTKKIAFSYTKDLTNTDFFLPFYNPVIYLHGLNSIGIPAKYELDYVKMLGVDPDTQQRTFVTADFNGQSGTEFVLNYPTPAEIKGLNTDQLIDLNTTSIIKTTDFKLDKDFGHTDRLFQIKGDSLEYHYKIRPIDVQGENIAYFFDDSQIDIIIDAELMCKFKGNKDNPNKNFYIERRDTVKFDLSKASLDSTAINLNDDFAARVRISLINHLPVGGVAEYNLLSKDLKSGILPQKNGSLTLKEAPIDSEGRVTADAPNVDAYVKFTYDEYKELVKTGGGMQIVYRVDNKSYSDIWFKSNDWIDGTVDLWAKGFITYDANKGKGGSK